MWDPRIAFPLLPVDQELSEVGFSNALRFRTHSTPALSESKRTARFLDSVPQNDRGRQAVDAPPCDPSPAGLQLVPKEFPGITRGPQRAGFEKGLRMGPYGPIRSCGTDLGTHRHGVDVAYIPNAPARSYQKNQFANIKSCNRVSELIRSKDMFTFKFSGMQENRCDTPRGNNFLFGQVYHTVASQAKQEKLFIVAKGMGDTTLILVAWAVVAGTPSDVDLTAAPNQNSGKSSSCSINGAEPLHRGWGGSWWGTWAFEGVPVAVRAGAPRPPTSCPLPDATPTMSGEIFDVGRRLRCSYGSCGGNAGEKQIPLLCEYADGEGPRRPRARSAGFEVR
ncbi:hypothetical protein B0H13DRAFT_1853570 [Mycena leptocephala]|nr:hypothetical protein B0H13DRAFT_1853570 [Mycena leptocephala]